MQNQIRTFQEDMAWSTKLFNHQIWPLIKPYLDGGQLMRMEDRPDVELARALDMKAGIDGWHLHTSGMRGIASRVQEARRPWDTFTIRMSRDSGAITEYKKRRIALNEPQRGWIYPALTVHAYAATKDGPILSCGIARTADIIRFVDSGLHYLQRTTNATFAVCPWAKMKNEGLKVKIIRSANK